MANVSSVATRSKSNDPIGRGVTGDSTRQSMPAGTATVRVHSAPRNSRPKSSLTHAIT